jgi:pimeloyl-ACP methyl ester carboxylesterase
MIQLLASLFILSLLSAHRAPTIPPASHRVSFVTVAPGVRLEVLDWGGTGPLVVFLSGFGNTSHVFDGFAPQFTSAHRVIGLTRRGFGASSRPTNGYDSATLSHDILTVLDSLGVRRATFIAHSFGGSELNDLGAFHADRVSRLVYLDASYDFARLYADSMWQHAFPIPRPAAPTTGARDDLRRWFGLVMGPALPDDEIDALTSAGASDAIGARLQRGAAAVELRRITPPVLALWAMPRSPSDQYPYWASLAAADRRRLSESFRMQQSVRRTHLEAFRMQVPNAHIVPIVGGRHYLFLSQPETVARAMRAWLASQPARQNER